MGSSQVQIALLIREFNTFSKNDNDPYEEHNFGSIEYNIHIVYWKIDHLGKTGEVGSPDSANPDIMTRVMTIMLADER